MALTQHDTALQTNLGIDLLTHWADLATQLDLLSSNYLSSGSFASRHIVASQLNTLNS